MDSLSFVIALLGCVTGAAALILQWRQQNKETQARQAELLMSAHAQAAQEADATTEQLAKISTLSMGLIDPLQDQITALSGRMTVMEGQVQRYRRWIVELVLITQKYASHLEDANLHDMIFTEIAADGTISALIEAIGSPKPGEAPGAPGLSPTGRLRTLKPH